METVALYMRLSSEDVHEGESYSIGNQRDLLYSYIREHREFDGCSILEFSDDGYSGVNFERPGIQKLLSLAGKMVGCILVKDFSRFGRNLLEVGDYLDQVFPFLGVRFIAVNEGYDSGKGLGSSVSLDVSLKAMVYEMYSRDVSEKVRSVKQAKMRKGEYQCAIAFYGYKKSAKVKNKLEIDEPAAEVVRKIFRMAGGGLRPSQIALELNREDIPSPLMYRRANHTDGLRGWKVAGDAVWMRENVRRILLDERYTGCLIGHKRTTADISIKRTESLPKEEWIVAKDTHDAIVSKEEYTKAQEVIKHYILQKSQMKPIQKFRGILKCACCGRVLVRKAGKNPYFICLTARSIKDSECIKVHLGEMELEEALLEAIRTQVQLFIGNVSGSAKKVDIDLQKEIKECQLAISRYKALQAAAFEDYAEGRISRQEYLSRKQETAGHQEEMNSCISALNGQLAKQQGRSAGQGVNREKYVFIKELTREVLIELVKEIRASGDNRIEIKWNFCEGVPIDVLACQKAEN
ncbi:MAG: recombinase family protein [Acetatifactor sp.]|nr:recombinase family protein [Acetatifactor sp.]